jgi:pimeloyl-ACP methyl ester carboxylesterase
MTLPSLLLVPGAWHKPDHFRRLVDELSDIDVHTVTQTSSADYPAALRDMYADAEVIAQAAAAIDRQVVVVAHSYGGVPATQGLPYARNVRRIVYLAASDRRGCPEEPGRCAVPDPRRPRTGLGVGPRQLRGGDLGDGGAAGRPGWHRHARGGQYRRPGAPEETLCEPMSPYGLLTGPETATTCGGCARGRAALPWWRPEAPTPRAPDRSG